MISRRNFLAAGAGSLLFAGVPISASASVHSKESTDAIMGSQCKQPCKVYRDGLYLTQLNLVDLTRPPGYDPRVDQYVMKFEAPCPVALPEASYKVVHPTMGQLHLFLQPCGTLDIDDHDNRHYRACLAMLK